MSAYIRVAEEEEGVEPIEIPSENDNSILLSTLTSLFPGASGLKYRTETGSIRGIRLTENPLRLQPPDEGWRGSSVYYCVFPKENKRKIEDQTKTYFTKCEERSDVMIPKLSKKSFRCVDCNKDYSKYQYVIDHKRTIHCNSLLNYSCRVCGQTFGWRVTVLKHIKKSHPEKKSKDMVIDLFE